MANQKKVVTYITDCEIQEMQTYLMTPEAVKAIQWFIDRYSLMYEINTCLKPEELDI